MSAPTKATPITPTEALSKPSIIDIKKLILSLLNEFPSIQKIHQRRYFILSSSFFKYFSYSFRFSKKDTPYRFIWIENNWFVLPDWSIWFLESNSSDQPFVRWLTFLIESIPCCTWIFQQELSQCPCEHRFWTETGFQNRRMNRPVVCQGLFLFDIWSDIGKF